MLGAGSTLTRAAMPTVSERVSVLSRRVDDGEEWGVFDGTDMVLSRRKINLAQPKSGAPSIEEKLNEQNLCI